jgi:prevent-host-death family protein
MPSQVRRAVFTGSACREYDRGGARQRRWLYRYFRCRRGGWRETPVRAVASAEPISTLGAPKIKLTKNRYRDQNDPTTALPTTALHLDGNSRNLVSMTRTTENSPKSSRPPGSWRLQDAKARFSELVRCARSEGPQHVTVHGREEVVVVSAEEFRRLEGDLTGEVLIAAMQASPHRDIEIEPSRAPMPVRGVDL